MEDLEEELVEGLMEGMMEVLHEGLDRGLTGVRSWSMKKELFRRNFDTEIKPPERHIKGIEGPCFCNVGRASVIDNTGLYAYDGKDFSVA